ncbi:uncharacterized protein LOC124373975 [Homalodisca vitripennis]|uniref:uncharacterized protein LOC124373975 n=1 Tax=Homalodisca vitripennis TaxID=197043 RepID=UPI001EEC2A07|nr:uncharacterized protein LOC124373975 [Homalodisca vitripennis]
MNGPMSMYKLKPVVHFPDSINITDTMYKMKNIYSSNINPSEETYSITNGLPNVLEQKSPVEVEELKKRQEAILKQLTYLKEQMLALREELGKKNSSSDPSSLVSKKISPSHTNIAKEVSWVSRLLTALIRSYYYIFCISVIIKSVKRLRKNSNLISDIQDIQKKLRHYHIWKYFDFSIIYYKQETLVSARHKLILYSCHIWFSGTQKLFTL